MAGEVCGQIFEYLDSKDLRKCELVSKRWRAVVHENSVWRHLFFRTLQEQQGVWVCVGVLGGQTHMRVHVYVRACICGCPL